MRRVKRPSRFALNEGKRFRLIMEAPMLDQQRLMYATHLEVAALDKWVNDCYDLVADLTDALCDSRNTLILDVHGLRRSALSLTVEAANINSLANSIMKVGYDADTTTIRPPFPPAHP